MPASVHPSAGLLKAAVMASAPQQLPLMNAACSSRMRAAAGHPEEAFPLLEKGLSVAVDNYNHHVSRWAAGHTV